MYAIVPISDPGKPPPNPPALDIVTYCPSDGTSTILPGLSPARLTNAPCPAKIPRVGNTAALVNPALRADSIRRSVVCNSSAIFSQLVVAGRSSGPRDGVAAGAPAVAGVAV